MVRGLNPEEFSPEDNVLVFLGISCYIGVQRGRQDEEGNMLSEFYASFTATRRNTALT